MVPRKGVKPLSLSPRRRGFAKEIIERNSRQGRVRVIVMMLGLGLGVGIGKESRSFSHPGGEDLLRKLSEEIVRVRVRVTVRVILLLSLS
jgi:hypothetical protein